MHYVGKTHSFLMLVEMVHIFTTRLLTVSKLCNHVAMSRPRSL